MAEPKYQIGKAALETLHTEYCNLKPMRYKLDFFFFPGDEVVVYSNYFYFAKVKPIPTLFYLGTVSRVLFISVDYSNRPEEGL